MPPHNPLRFISHENADNLTILDRYTITWRSVRKLPTKIHSDNRHNTASIETHNHYPLTDKTIQRFFRQTKVRGFWLMILSDAYGKFHPVKFG